MITVKFIKKDTFSVIQTWDMPEVPQTDDFVQLDSSLGYRVVGRIWKNNKDIHCIVRPVND